MKKKFFATILFWAILLLIYLGVDGVLQQKFTEDGSTSDTFVTDQFYKLKADSVDVFFLGSSQNVRGISCMKLLEDYDISAFSISTSAQPLGCTYYYLMEILKNQHPKVFLLDTSMLYEDVKENGFRRVSDNAPLSFNKLSMLIEHAKYLTKDRVRYFMSYLFPVLQFHQRWKELTEVDFEPTKTENRVFRGNILQMTTTSLKEDVIIRETDAPEVLDMEPNQRENMLRIADYCKAHDIKLVLFKTPKQEWTWNRYEGMRELAEDYGLEYYDFNTEDLFTACGFDEKQDFHDTSHLNQRGAVKLTDYLGKYLRSNYDLPRAQLTKDDESDLEKYHKSFRQGLITSAVYTEDFLDSLKCGGDCEILIQKTGPISSSWEAAYEALLKELGLSRCAFSDAEGDVNYVAHIRRGEVVYEDAAASEIKYEGSLEDGTAFLLTSGKDTKTMTIGDKKLDLSPGINICVLDADKGTFLAEANPVRTIT